MRRPQPADAPSPGERARTLAAVAEPTRIICIDSDAMSSPARGAVDDYGCPILLVKPSDALHSGLRAGDGTDVPVTVDLAVERVLGQTRRTRGVLKVQGWALPVPPSELRQAAVVVAERCPDEDLFTVLDRPLDPEAPLLARVDVAYVSFQTADMVDTLDADDYLTAAPDPLLPMAESMLHHVNEAHRDELVHCLRRIPGAPRGEVWLWELDRFGATLRVDTSNEPVLIRIPWPSPAVTPAGLEQTLRCLLTSTRHGIRQPK